MAEALGDTATLGLPLAMRKSPGHIFDVRMGISIGAAVILVALFLLGSLRLYLDSSSQYPTAFTQAHVLDSQKTYDNQGYLDVRFSTRESGQVTTFVVPNDSISIPQDRLVPIRYVPGDPSDDVYYAGPGGDYDYSSPRLELLLVIALGAIAIALSWLFFMRWFGRIKAAKLPTRTLVSPHGSYRVLQENGHWADQGAASSGSGPELVWSRIIKRVNGGPLEVHGDLCPNSWVVLRETESGRWLWPSTKSEPRLGTGLPTIERKESGETVYETARVLLSAYVGLFDHIVGLPLLINRDTTGARHSVVGLPRPVLRLLFGVHVRRYIRHLQDGLTRRLLRDPGMSNEERDLLVDLGTDGDAFIASLRVHRAFLRLLPLVSAIPVVLGLWFAIFPRATQSVTFSYFGNISLTVLVIALGLAFVPFIWLNRAVTRVRRLMGTKFVTLGATNGLPRSDESSRWSAADLEDVLDQELGGPVALQWESNPWIRRIVGAIFGCILLGTMLVAAISHGRHGQHVVFSVTACVVAGAALVLYRPLSLRSVSRRRSQQLKISVLTEGLIPDQVSTPAT